MSMGWMSRLGMTAVVAGGVAIGLSGVAAITAPDGGVDAARAARVLTVATMKARLAPGYEVRREFVGRVEARRESQVGFELGSLFSFT